ncbi:Rieske (2Fe-2S) protein [Rhizobium sp. TRM95796]|uniref:Rieske (2Fe-2S) protein n=1 Tax=Rhizobium sp. TRM95796 TaxID=2979862 RepID=UPI0021E8E8D6|nr:Rieske (2Fe-2S) protein [Rhizobium sp. TRM95796]MCV3767655.1 Rieske (2Fe-2S) protein [Rhizobium sp. TRM95796]
MTAANGWTPVALSASIEAGTSAGTQIDGFEVVVWRDNSGKAHVWEDRCPHRGMRMSFGFVRGDHIACLYHGWQYDTGGQCRYIPAHPDLKVPATIKIPSYAVTERGGVIWTCLAETADASALPTVSDDVSPIRSLYIDRAAETIAPMLSCLPVDGADVTVETLSSGAVLFTSGDVKLLVAVQSIAADKSALHLTVLGAVDASTQKSIAKWAENARRVIEAAPIAPIAKVA